MDSESLINDYLIFIWVGGLLAWVVWVMVKIYGFKRQTQIQQAISKPQLRSLSIQLLKGTLWACLFISLVVFVPAVFLNPGEFREYIPVLFCIIPMVLFACGYLLSELQALRFFFNFTDQEVVPIPKPLPPRPYADRSFEDLSQELDQALAKLEQNG